MENQLASKNSNTEITQEVLENYLLGSGTKLSGEQKTLFFQLALRNKLDPFKREIYAIPYERSVKDDKGVWKKVTDVSIVTGYQVYLKIAAQSGKLNGFSVETIGVERKIVGSKATIYRKDRDHPFVWEVSFDEFAKKNKDGNLTGSWATMPEFMIKKVCLAQAFRLAFPEELGGMVYTQEEIDQQGGTSQQVMEVEVVKTIPTIPTPPVYKAPETPTVAIDNETEEFVVKEMMEARASKPESHVSEVSGEAVPEKVYSFSKASFGVALTFAEQQRAKKHFPGIKGQQLVELLKEHAQSVASTEGATYEDIPF